MWHVAAHEGYNEEIRCGQKQEADEDVVDVQDAQHSDERFVSNEKHDRIPADVGNIRQMTDDFAKKQKRQNTNDRQQNLLDKGQDIIRWAEKSQHDKQDERCRKDEPHRHCIEEIAAVNQASQIEKKEISERFAYGGGQVQHVSQQNAQPKATQSQQNFRLYVSLQHIKRDIEHEECPKEPQWNVGIVIVCEEGIEQPPVVSSPEFYPTKLVKQDGKQDGCGQVKEAERNEQSLRLFLYQLPNAAIRFEEQAGQKDVQRHPDSIEIRIEYCMNAKYLCQMKPDNQQDAYAFCQIEVRNPTFAVV